MSKDSSSVSSSEDDSFQLDVLSSEESLPYVSFGPDRCEVAQPYEYHLHSVCGLAVRCEHSSMPLSSVHCSGKCKLGLWLPYVSLRQCFNVHKFTVRMTEFFLKELNFPCDRQKLLEGEMPLLFEKVTLHSIQRIQLTNGEFIDRLVYMARWKSADKNCCKDTSNVKWIPISVASESAVAKSSSPTNTITSSQNVDLIARFWGSEIAEFAELLKSDQCKQLQLSEQTTDQMFRYLNPKKNSVMDELTGPSAALPKLSPVKEVIQFVAESRITEADAVKMYSDFVQHCFPSTDMSLTSFRSYCLKVGIAMAEDRFACTFRAMNYRESKGYLTFHEFMLGFIALDPDSPNRPPRHSFLFRYYDTNSDGILDKADIVLLMSDLGQAGELSDSKMSMLDFVQAIESRKLKDTTGLCRLSRSVVLLMLEANVYELIPNKHNRLPTQSSCHKCKPKNYSLALHSVRLTQTGRITEPRQIVSLDRSSELNLSNGQSKQQQPNLWPKHSTDYTFNATSTANQVLQLVRRLAGLEQMADEKKKEVLAQVQNGLSVSLISALCDEVNQILSVEPRVLPVSSPTLVLGDIHGNISDLLCFERQLWPMAPAFEAPSVLFLGDYVDRGECGIEVACYLFAMKVLAPNKFFLLRGNHEVRQVQRMFTFEKECTLKYGCNGGQCVFDLLNRVFDFLPFAAVIDQLIFCAHGGIPYSVTKIEDLNLLPVPLVDPEKEAPAVHEILWSDPISTPDLQKVSVLLKKKDDSGYLHNTKRNTGYFFGESATASFLTKNNLSHIIRAHEVVNHGYKLDHNGTVLTVFSCSHYCTGTNEAAVIMVEAYSPEGAIKILIVET